MRVRQPLGQIVMEFPGQATPLFLLSRNQSSCQLSKIVLTLTQDTFIFLQYLLARLRSVTSRAAV